MKMRRKILLPLLAAGVLLSGCSRQEQEAAVYDESSIAMGTVVTERVYTQGEDPTADVLGTLSQIEREYLSWREEDSAVGKINLRAGKGRISADGQTIGYLLDPLKLAKKSGGAFDPTMGKLTRLWDVEAEDPKIPSQEEISRLLEESGYEKIHLGAEEDRGWVELEEGASIDLGAVGKGIGCDEAVAFLKKDPQVKGAVIAVGGSVLTLGAKPDGTPWKVAIRDPRGGQEELLGVLELEGERYVSTSGDYEKYFIQDGKRYHHILDPATGYPADAGLISVTVLGENGALSDGLSTACFVLGSEKGAELLKEYGAEGIFVDKDKKVYVTEGIREKFSLEASGYVVFPFPS